jgi:hypothetical protein
MQDRGHPGDPVSLRIIGIVTQLKMDIQIDQETGSNADSKAQDIDERKGFVAKKIPPGDF